jgi:cyanate permease
MGPFLAGYIYDTNGNYRLAFLLCGVAGIAAGIVIWLVKPAAKQRN